MADRDMSCLALANITRQVQGAARSCAQVRVALGYLGPAAAPRQAAAGRLRLAHPDASLAELAALADEPLTKHAVAALLYRLVHTADRAARRAGYRSLAHAATVLAQAARWPFDDQSPGKDTG